MILIDSWPYDLMLKGELQLESEITEHEVETGGAFADHIRPKPITFTLEAWVSNTPIGKIASDPSRVDLESDAVFSPVFSASNPAPLPSSEAHERLFKIWQDKRLVTIEVPVASRYGTPGKRTFASMAIESLSEQYGPDGDGGLLFSVTFKQVRIVQNKRLTVRTAVPRGQGKGGTRSASGQSIKGNTSVAWNMGTIGAAPLPGGAVTARSPQAEVLITKGGLNDPKSVYRWGKLSGGNRDPIPPPYLPKTGSVLSPFAEKSFHSDLKRDIAEAKANQERAEDAERAGKPSNKLKGLGRNSLPEGLSLDRFTTPRPPGTPAPAANNPNAAKLPK